VSDLRVLAGRVAKVPAAATAAAAAELARTAAAVGASYAPAGMGVRGRRFRLGATVERTGARAAVAGRPAAGWVWATSGTRGHAEAPARGRVLAGGLAHPVGVPVRHPGARGRRLWDRVAGEAPAVLVAAVVAELGRAVR